MRSFVPEKPWKSSTVPCSIASSGDMRYPSKAGTPAIATTSRAIAAIRLANQSPELRSNSISAPGQLRPSPSFPHGSDRVQRRLGGVLPPRRGGPPGRARGDLLDLPAGVLLEPVLVTAFRCVIVETTHRERRHRRNPDAPLRSNPPGPPISARRYRPPRRRRPRRHAWLRARPVGRTR